MKQKTKRVRKSSLEANKDKVEVLALQIKQRRLEKMLAPKAKYDVLDNGVSGKKRRQPRIEKDTEDQQVKSFDRLRAINLVRDIERNFTSCRSMMHQIKINTVGTGPKARLHTSDTDFILKNEQWLNSSWAKNCDFRGTSHFGDLLQLIFASAVREGDVLVALDDGWIDDSGKILTWEADQLVQVSDPDNVPSFLLGKIQEQGVWKDEYGRVVGYSVSTDRGVSEKKAEECTFLTAENARLLKMEWRLNCARGQSAMLTAAADLQDLYEMRSKEMQSAKVAASIAGIVKKEGSTKEMLDLAQINVDEEQAPEVNYERFESMTGGMMEYMEPGDDFKILDYDRPTVNFAEAFDFILRSAGSALGLSKTYTTLSTESSYTAFRGDMLLSWKTFYSWQKLLERQICDWLAQKVLTWHNGSIPEDLVISFSWPEMPVIDPLKDAAADRERLGSLTTDYAELLGPDWKKRFEAISEQLAYAKNLGIPLDIIYGEAGAIAATRTVSANHPEKDTSSGSDSDLETV
jgi:capsid protein